jgi:hypothetical protein
MIRIGKDFRRTPEEKSHRGVVADVAAPDVPVITDRPQTASDRTILVRDFIELYQFILRQATELHFPKNNNHARGDTPTGLFKNRCPHDLYTIWSVIRSSFVKRSRPPRIKKFHEREIGYS